MKTSTLLRIAAVFTFLLFAGHTSGIPWTPDEGPGGVAVIEAMKSHHFDVIGVSRSYWDFYFGWGLMISVLFLLSAILLWQLGGLAKTDAHELRSIIAVFLAAFVANAVLGWVYFFAIPAVMAMLIAICLALALVMAGNHGKASETSTDPDNI